MIYSDYSTNPRDVVQAPAGEAEVIERLRGLRNALYGEGQGDPEAFLQIVRSTRLFDNQMETAEKFAEEAFV